MHLYNYYTIKIDIDFTQCVRFFFSNIVKTHCPTNQTNREIRSRKGGRKPLGGNIFSQ